MHRIKVELQERSYDIVIEPGIIAGVGAMIRGMGFTGKTAIVTNPKIEKLYGAPVASGLREAGLSPFVITIPDGEQYKTLDEAAKVYDALIGHRMERGNPVIALGGGVIGDMAGFVAATYLRGVPYIQVPTTLLAQVDSSVGGKTAVNHPRGKNLIGAFYQPRAVFIDPEVLTTLDGREFRAGLAEVAKYGVIKDGVFFRYLEDSSGRLLKPGPELIHAIKRSCELKAEVVGADEREGGLRAILNFGHTFGHAIEALSGYGKFMHGEAVSMGMVMAGRLSLALGLCQPDVPQRIERLLVSLGLPVAPPQGVGAGAMVDSIRLDKKVSGSRMRFVLATSIGEVVLRDVEEAELRSFLSANGIS